MSDLKVREKESRLLGGRFMGILAAKNFAKANAGCFYVVLQASMESSGCEAPLLEGAG